MTPRRAKDAEPRGFEEFSESMLMLWGAIEGSRTTCAELIERRAATELAEDDRARAIASATHAATAVLLLRRMMGTVFHPDEVMDVYLPWAAFDAADRLAYALAALGEPDPEPEALLDRSELAELIAFHGLAEWDENMRERRFEPLGSRR